MGGNAVIFAVFATLMAVVSCENATSVKPPPSKEVAEKSGICRVCSCNNFKVDCFDRKINKYFSQQEWADLTEFKPITVDLSQNEFTNVTMMADLPIEILNLSRSGIEIIENASFKGLQDMQILDLSHNKLTTANLSPHAFEGRYAASEYEPLLSLRILNLAYNDLHSLHQDLFEHISKLEELDISGNPLTMIDHGTVIAISSLTSLRVLRMRSCQLTEIPEKFLHTPRNLERLDISDNQLTAVPQELAETKNLKFLNLNQNKIVRLDMTSTDYLGFPQLTKLEELHMCNIPTLKYIGAGALAGLENLKSLHMSFNPSLEHIDPKALARPDEIGEVFDWPPVRELYLQSNNLTEVDSRFLSRWDLVEKLDVSDNPYLCDCSTQWMVDDLTPTVDKLGGNSSLMVCQEPIEMRGKTMRHLHDNHSIMRCVDKYGHRPERDGAILLGLLIGVLLAVPLMLGLILLWRHGYFSWMGLRPPSNVSRAFYKRAPAEDNYF